MVGKACVSGESSVDRMGWDGRAVVVIPGDAEDMQDMGRLHLEAQAAHACDVSLDKLAALLVCFCPVRLQEAIVPRRLGLRARAAPMARISTLFTLVPRMDVHTASGPSG